MAGSLPGGDRVSPDRVDLCLMRLSGRRASSVSRRRFGRAVLREYLDSNEITLRLSESGKWRLHARRGGQALHFNLSSTSGMVVCAVAGREVGVDVERLQCDVDWRPVAWRFYTHTDARSRPACANSMSLARCSTGR
jgi:phosphopantetheinyl transferase